MYSLDVCAAVVFRGGKLLLATRPEGRSFGGLWEFPGGKRRDGEGLGECIRRELREELALEVDSPRPVGTLHGKREDGTQITLHFMLCMAPADAEAVPQEGQKAQWFPPSRWDALELAPMDREFIRSRRAELLGLSQESLSLDGTYGHLPPWLKTPFEGGERRMEMKRLLRGGGLHTVCEGAKCPNRCECWRNRTATFMILGDTCTRACRFCSVNHGKPSAPDPDEPRHIAESVVELGLKYAVVTCVTRDDLPDGGSGAMADVVRVIRSASPGTLVEVLTSDYNGDRSCIESVIQAGPAVFGHNIETVERLSPQIRSRATYRRTLEVLAYAASLSDGSMAVKSGLMLGLGEEEEEIRQTLRDLRGAGVSIVTLGQYLQPTPAQVPVSRFIPPSEFLQWRRFAEEELGFARAVCGPLVRSSYLAGEAYFQATGTHGCG